MRIGVNLKILIAKKIPLSLLNNSLLSLPILYKNKFINFESYLDEDAINELLNAIQEVKNLSGNIIECGCARCGTTCILANYLKSNNIKKKIFALDSFKGFEKNELEDAIKKGLSTASSKDFTHSSYDYVQKKIKKLRLTKFIIPIEGYFEQILSKIDSNYCLGFIDCDLKESMTYSAETIWPKLTHGGKIFFDDYYGTQGSKGARSSIDNFVKNHLNEIEEYGITNRLYHVTKKR